MTKTMDAAKDLEEMRAARFDDALETENFAAIAKRRHEELRALMAAPLAEREAAMNASAQIAVAYYATPEGREELADWRAIQGEPFHDDLGDYQE